MPLINFSGLASGIDSDSLIKATSDAARKINVEPSQTKVTELESENSSLEELRTKLNTLRDNARTFSTLKGGGLVKEGQSNNESIAGASATGLATNGTYGLTVTQLAKNATYALSKTSGTYASTTDAIGSSTETITVTIGTGSSMETVNVSVVGGTTTLASFVTSFNTASSKAEASLVNVGTSSSPSYKVVINSLKQGTTEGTISVSASSNVTASGDQATNSTFTIAGIGSISRSTNEVSDVISGVTFSLRSLGSATIQITDDVDSSAARIQDLVDSFNDVVKFIRENNTITREESGSDVKNVFAALAKTNVDNNALTAIKNALQSTRASAGTSIKIFPDIGITTERDGTLKFDTDIFETAMSSESSSVNSILTNFADTTSVTAGTIDQFVRFNGLLDITINNNKQRVIDLNQRIGLAEANIKKQEDSMRSRFARLEAMIGKLQSQQNSLTSTLAGLR